ncbi:MAG TPA: hypothetical protein VGV68_04950 [Terriglobia bacterium]|nr:hypothetical protein [Terriglobia bacterium]
MADGVKEYIRGGGTVVAEARLAWNDERGFASEVVPGLGLAEVFGAREKLIRPVDKAEILVRPSVPSGGLEGLGAGPIFGDGFEEALEPLAGGG